MKGTEVAWIFRSVLIQWLVGRFIEHWLFHEVMFGELR